LLSFPNLFSELQNLENGPSALSRSESNGGASKDLAGESIFQEAYPMIGLLSETKIIDQSNVDYILWVKLSGNLLPIFTS